MLTQAEGEKKIPEINEPHDDDDKSPKDVKKNAAWWLWAVLPKHVHFETSDKIYYFWFDTFILTLLTKMRLIRYWTMYYMMNDEVVYFEILLYLHYFNGIFYFWLDTIIMTFLARRG